LIALDLESIVRPIISEPYKEQHTFQIGAIRFGSDTDWVLASPKFNAYSTLPNIEDEQLIYRDDVRARYLEKKQPLSDVLQALSEFCRGADVLAAYNGTAHDFPLLATEYERCNLRPFWDSKLASAPRLVDGLYLAQALWPIPPRQHRLRDLLERLAVKVDDLVWHDALDDAQMLVELMSHAASSFLPSLNPSLLELLISVGKGSDAWAFLFSLAGIDIEPRRFDGSEVANVIASIIAPNQRKRRRPEVPQEENETKGDGSNGMEYGMPSHTTQPFTLPTNICGADGRLDIDSLIRVLRGESAEARPSQRDMLEHLREWIRLSCSALVEAPTGIGKSYVLLAAALEWLVEHPENRVIISTYTKQLQSQLANDIEHLAELLLPELVGLADMVKGASNRLSLRALVICLAELTEEKQRRRPRRRSNFSEDQRFRDLVLYLLLRFLAEGKPTEEWEAHSVDKVDVPGFFIDYCGPRLSLYLLSLSQADAGDYPETRLDEIARYTVTVREALATRRLIIANHALLLAHHEDLDEIRARTLLLIDEAHEFENAASQTMSSSFDSGIVTSLAEDIFSWLTDQPPGAGGDTLADILNDFDRYLDDERLPRAAMIAFTSAESDPLSRSYLRTVTVASPLQGDAYVRPMENLANELRTTRRWLKSLLDALRSVPRPENDFEADRLFALVGRTTELGRALEQVIIDIDAVFTTENALVGQDNQVEHTDEADLSGQFGDADEQDELVLVEAEEEPEEYTDTTSLSEIHDSRVELGVTVQSNKVVWAEELEELHPGRLRRYRFRIVSSPIEIGREEAWQRFKRGFARTFYVSATLRVAEKWEFIRNRLALPEGEIDAIQLQSPFDMARQARLICFEDFPSWSEHNIQAMRTMAHQLSGYATDVIQENHNGAMVLTTSRAATAGVFDDLAHLRIAAGKNYQLLSTGLEGNQRAVEAFRRDGGILVGTRGLWQGVDINDPERLRLVWINKLPFASFADPVIIARRELVRQRAELIGEEDPDAVANETYYLPLAALALRQAVGRLIRTQDHCGVIIISDRKLAGPTRLRRLYRHIFLGSLDPGLLMRDAETGELGLGNVCTMQEGWRRIFDFFARSGIIAPDRAATLSEWEVLERFTELPQTLAIIKEGMSIDEEIALKERSKEAFAEELFARCTNIAGHLAERAEGFRLKHKQEEAIRALAFEKDILAVLPTGYGKSYVFQLPALALPGVTIVVSPLVSLMTDQALELNRTIGGRVRALVAPMRESNSRTGKSEVHEELTGRRSHGIKLIYLSPERLCQRQFQDWIRLGVERGIIRRIALDEAHTFVQWGEDFRPSFKRAEIFLQQVKHNHPELRVLALTATANETVREGLKRSIFGLGPGESREDVMFITGNPIRPELALYRRTLSRSQGGHQSVAGLVERVVGALQGHAIFYCLTVRQVDQVYAHLTDYLQGHAVDVMRYHGRMTDVEKTAVGNAFRSAPPSGEEGFRRMIIVATSAFGLGIDRPDIRTVFCISPSTDLASLYQQLGRAGRDRAANPLENGEYTAGMALTYPRAQRTLAFMTRRRIRDELFVRIAAMILDSDSPISTQGIADSIIAEDLAAGRIDLEQASDQAMVDVYETAVVRVLAELSSRGILSDLGDFPIRISLLKGDYAPDTSEMMELVQGILAAVGSQRIVELLRIYECLSPKFPQELPDPGALWSLLLELHTLGYLDVSQWPNRGFLTAIDFHSRDYPEDLIPALSRRQQQIEREIDLLQSWFSSLECVNEGFRQYFDVDHLPECTCTQAENRCSTCWNRAGLLPDEEEPVLYEAFMSSDLRPAAASLAGRHRSERQLDNLVLSLIANHPRGLGRNLILAVLKGEDHYFNLTEGRRKPLWPSLLLSRVRGRKPGLRQEDLDASLTRLESSGELIREGGLWRFVRYIVPVTTAQTTGPGEQEP
jgi:ATP-dependent DNA helicase RecQ